MRSITPQRSIAHMPQQTAQMTLVRLPDGGMGWVPTAALGQVQAQAQQQAHAAAAAVVPSAAHSVITKLLVVGGLGLAGWWAWKKWGSSGESSSFSRADDEDMDDEDSDDEREAGERYVKSRRHRRSRSRLLSEFKQFLNDDA